MSASPLLTITNLHKSFTSADKKHHAVIAGLNFSLFSGEMVAIMGPSGEGKSTLLSLIAHLDTYDAGRITFPQYIQKKAKIDPDALRKEHLGMIFQNNHLLEDLTLQDNLNMVYILHGKPINHLRIKSYLQELNIEDVANQRVRLLSGGQKQRGGIARALILNPQIILADEPTGNLDSTASAQVINTLHTFTRDQKNNCSRGIVIVTHDHAVASRCDRILNLEKGQLTPL